MEKKKVGVILSGCGVMDGAEIHESVFTLLALDREGVEAVCFAPDVDQVDVVDHVAGKPVSEKRNVLRESARIARGQISDIKAARAKDLDAIVLPGGYGAAKNLSDFATGRDSVKVNGEVARLIRDMHAERKPMGFWCIAPAVVAATFCGTAVHPKITIGNDAGTASRLEAMGARHETQPVTGVTVDRDNRIVTTPCYMLAQRIGEVERGIASAVHALLDLARS